MRKIASKIKNLLAKLNFKLTITPKKLVKFMIFLGVAVVIAYPYWEMKRLRHEIYWLQYNTYGWTWLDGANNNTAGTAEEKVSFKLLSQIVKELEISDPDFVYSKELEVAPFVKRDVRILEVEINNSTSSLYNAGYSISAVGTGGVIKDGFAIRLKEGTADYEKNQKSSGVQLAPGGKTTIYLYFLDDGNEITKLFNSDSYEFIDLTK